MQFHNESPAVVSSPDRSEIRSFFVWVRDFLAKDLERLTPEIESLAADGTEEIAPLAELTVQRVRVLTELAEALCGGMGREDRILPLELLKEQFAALEPQAQRRRTEFRFRDVPAKSGPLYGSRKWLGYAFSSYLAQVLDCAPYGASVEVDLRQSSLSIVVSARWEGNGIDGGAKGGSLGSGPDLLPLALSNTILEAHGGRAKRISLYDGETATDRFRGFIVTLPTGAPADNIWVQPCPDHLCPVRRRTDRMARDLSMLLIARKNANKESANEKSIDRR